MSHNPLRTLRIEHLEERTMHSMVPNSSQLESIIEGIRQSIVRLSAQPMTADVVTSIAITRKLLSDVEQRHGEYIDPLHTPGISAEEIALPEHDETPRQNPIVEPEHVWEFLTHHPERNALPVGANVANGFGFEQHFVNPYPNRYVLVRFRPVEHNIEFTKIENITTNGFCDLDPDFVTKLSESAFILHPNAGNNFLLHASIPSASRYSQTHIDIDATRSAETLLELQQIQGMKLEYDSWTLAASAPFVLPGEDVIDRPAYIDSGARLKTQLEVRNDGLQGGMLAVKLSIDDGFGRCTDVGSQNKNIGSGQRLLFDFELQLPTLAEHAIPKLIFTVAKPDASVQLYERNLNRPDHSERALNQYSQAEQDRLSRLTVRNDRIADSSDPRIIAAHDAFFAEYEENTALFNPTLVSAIDVLAVDSTAKVEAPRLHEIRVSPAEALMTIEDIFTEPPAGMFINGSLVRTDTMSGKIFHALFQNYYGSLEREYLLRCVESLTGIPVERLKSAESPVYQEWISAIEHCFRSAGYGHIFVKQSSTSTLALTAHAHELTTEAVRIHWDVPVHRTISHARVYIQSNGTSLELPDLTGYIASPQMFVDIPKDKFQMTGTFQLKVAVWFEDGTTMGCLSEPVRVEVSSKVISQRENIPIELPDGMEDVFDFGDLEALPKNKQLMEWLMHIYIDPESKYAHKLIFDPLKKEWKGAQYNPDDGPYGLGGECKWWVQNEIINKALSIYLPRNSFDLYAWEAHDRIEIVAQNTENNLLDDVLQSQFVYAGDLIQFVTQNGTPHTIIVGSIRKDGIWVFDSNYNNDDSPRYHFISFSSLDAAVAKFSIYRIRNN